jgi:hypothetical protein
LVRRLHFVEYDQIPSWSDFAIQVDGKLRENPVRIEISAKETSKFGILLEVAVDGTLVFVPPELLEKERLARLPGTPKEERLPPGGGPPFQKLLIKIPVHRDEYEPGTNARQVLSEYNVNECTFKG